MRTSRRRTSRRRTSRRRTSRRRTSRRRTSRRTVNKPVLQAPSLVQQVNVTTIPEKRSKKPLYAAATIAGLIASGVLFYKGKDYFKRWKFLNSFENLPCMKNMRSIDDLFLCLRDDIIEFCAKNKRYIEHEKLTSKLTLILKKAITENIPNGMEDLRTRLKEDPQLIGDFANSGINIDDLYSGYVEDIDLYD